MNETKPAEYDKLKARLEDLIEERDFVLSSSGVHLQGGIVEKYEQEIKNLEQKLNLLKTDT